jgi:glycosyltransferase involved in cell wall biosynthesis
VTVVANCAQRATIDGVAYVPLEQTGRLEADIAIITTSGDRLDLTPGGKLGSEAGLRMVWVHGATRPAGLDEVEPDFVYAVSNFIADAVRSHWGVSADRVFVSYNGYEEDVFAEAETSADARDPLRLTYFSHPSKGLETAIAVLRELRVVDARFHLKVYGNEALWGQDPSAHMEEPGVSWEGLIGQGDLARQLVECTYSLQLQHREEPGALAIMEALRAGCILLASPVGCYPEMIANGVNGFLIQGDHRLAETRWAAAETIAALHQNSALREAVRQAAQAAPWSSDTMAATWEGHWDWWFGGSRREVGSSEACLVCSGPTLSLADGLHCLDCSSYRARVSQPAEIA